MAVFKRSIQGQVTFNMNAQKAGWSDGVLVAWNQPRPTFANVRFNNTLDYTIENFQDSCLCTGTVTLTSFIGYQSVKTLMKQTLNGDRYNYGNVITKFMTEVPYGLSSMIRLYYSGSMVFPYFEVVFSDGSREVHTDYEVSGEYIVNDIVYFHHPADTQSWGSEQERDLFIPFQDPLPGDENH